ncbi:hypothetical protein JTB14_004321 [Gonioctena quinquepunctata]|nr:hypothetical protein JTB14_004321 [Gonioctena quinquepunctata]
MARNPTVHICLKKIHSTSRYMSYETLTDRGAEILKLVQSSIEKKIGINGIRTESGKFKMIMGRTMLEKKATLDGQAYTLETMNDKEFRKTIKKKGWILNDTKVKIGTN